MDTDKCTEVRTKRMKRTLLTEQSLPSGYPPITESMRVKAREYRAAYTARAKAVIEAAICSEISPEDQKHYKSRGPKDSKQGSLNSRLLQHFLRLDYSKVRIFPPYLRGRGNWKWVKYHPSEVRAQVLAKERQGVDVKAVWTALDRDAYTVFVQEILDCSSQPGWDFDKMLDQATAAEPKTILELRSVLGRAPKQPEHTVTDRWEEIVALYQANIPLKEIQESLGLSKDQLCRAKKRLVDTFGPSEVVSAKPVQVRRSRDCVIITENLLWLETVNGLLHLKFPLGLTFPDSVQNQQLLRLFKTTQAKVRQIVKRVIRSSHE